ncbi:hypothetical protein CARUB_v10019886mg [Capsella rubella]|uniref:non-specific serine/threonine protein kinase n=1 Tax=Capsella rubella TaxID=81985 RepID=R0GDJ9_9BRAS|nr:hypothetical protein CARUB_v10019886mg [Capsella rubella]
MWSNSMIFLHLFTLSLLLGQSWSETDTLHQGQYLKDGQELVSAFKIFKLKFFNMEDSRNWYLGIWFNDLYLDVRDRPVWIANRNNPISERSGSLTVDSLGRLRILRGSSNMLELSSTEATRNTTLKLLDSGNLQLQEMDDSNRSVKRVLWQSFDYPTDTLLPGMKLGFDAKTGKRWELTSWLGDTLPSSGSFVFGMDANITNILTILWRGNSTYWSSGLWFNGRFSVEGLNECGFLFSYVSTKNGQYFTYLGHDQNDAETFFPTIMINQHGDLRRVHQQRIRQISRNSNCLAAASAIFRRVFYFLWREITPQVIGFIQRRLLSLRFGSTIDQEMLLRELGIDRRRKHKRSERKNNNELQIFSFESVELATDYFSDANKLGEGGFGPVYKGKLLNGEEVAIKRLSLASGQGLLEFKNEAMLIAKLQHTNLVQVLGCCIEKDEKMLIYEYMPNKSLDYFLFDPSRKNVLDWTMRFRIMEGIIQGLLYLHKYSRLKVIHRDIKASNILLDEDMNPKISDFGMARIFGAEETRANTKRVAGTFGYMSPEYFREGLFSAKSDVFSFGVLMLEIICGRKNNSFHHDSEGPLNLIVHVWNMFKENRIGEMIDLSLGDSALDEPQVLRCVQVALLCVQENPQDRPNMLDVVPMIYGEGNNALSLPKEPAFYDGPRRSFPETEVEPLEPENVSVNRVTITVMEAR